MNPDSGIYKKIYRELGEDFFNHLKAGDLNLYQTNNKGDLVKKGYTGRVFIHLPGSANSLNTAKAILAEKFLQQPLNKDLRDRFQITSSDFSDFLKNAILFEILKIMANVDGFNNVNSLANCGINDMDPDMRFEIAKIAVESNAMNVSQKIDEYNLTEAQRFEILKLAAPNIKNTLFFPDEVFNHFAKYNITDSNMRFEYVKVLAANNLSIDKILDEYNFTKDQNFEILMIAAVYRYIDISKFNFDQSDDFEIAKILATHSYCHIAFDIHKFNFNQEERFEVAEIAALHAVNNFSENIILFGLNQEQRFKVVKIAAMKDPVGVAHEIANYNLNEKQRFEIAKILVLKNPWVMNTYLQAFDLKNNFFLFEIIKSNAINGNEVSKDIDKYNFNHEQRFEIAKICAAKDLNLSFIYATII